MVYTQLLYRLIRKKKSFRHRVDFDASSTNQSIPIQFLESVRVCQVFCESVLSIVLSVLLVWRHSPVSSVSVLQVFCGDRSAARAAPVKCSRSAARVMAGSKMKVGDKFPTFRELEAAVKGYSEEKFVQFYKRDCRTVTAAKTKVKRFLNERLGMYQVVYCCIKGGKSFKSRSKGERDTR